MASALAPPAAGAATTSRYLNDVAALKGSDIWAVGSVNDGTRYRNFTRHWNGTKWKRVKTPSVGTGDNELRAVVAISHKNVWAVGYSSSSTAGTPLSLILHWNGVRWKVSKDAKPGGQHQLWDISAVNGHDIWAVGSSGGGGGPASPLVEHWNGSTWTRSSAANPGAGTDNLLGVAAVSHSDVWAVGWTGDLNTGTLVEHYDGSTWKVVTSPNPGTDYNQLQDVSAVSASDVWAVGNQSSGSAPASTLFEHWNGSDWQVVSSPNDGNNDPNYLQAIDMSSSSDGWSVGYTSGNQQLTTIQHWDGSSWSVVKSPDRGSGTNILMGVASITPTNAWAVGSRFANGAWKPLIEHWNGTSWKLS